MRASPVEERKESEHRAQGTGGRRSSTGHRRAESGEGSRLIRDRDQFEGSRLMRDKRGNNSQDNGA